MDSFEFKIPFSMCIVSRRNCGKTHMMEYLTDNFLENKLLSVLIGSNSSIQKSSLLESYSSVKLNLKDF